MLWSEPNVPAEAVGLVKLLESGGMAAFAGLLLWALIFKLPRDLNRIADRFAGALKDLARELNDRLKDSEERILNEVREKRRVR